MSKKANPRLVGSFVLGAIFLAVLGFFMLGGGLFREKIKCVAFFDGSVKGLSVGAPVAFRGVKVGTVTDIQLFVERGKLNYRIPVFFDIEKARLKVDGSEDDTWDLDMNRLIERGLRAQLTVQSFVTGLLMIELDFKPDTPVNIVGTEKGLPEIPTVPSDLADFLKRFEKVPVEDMLSQVTEIVRTLRNFLDSTDFKQALRDTRETLAGMNAIVAKVDMHADSLLNESTLTLHELRNTLTELNKGLAGLLQNLDGTMGAARSMAVRLDQQFPSFMVDMEKTLRTGQEAMQQVQVTLEKVEASARDDSPLMYSLQELLTEVAAASRSVRVLADYLQNHPEALLHGKKP